MGAACFYDKFRELTKFFKIQLLDARRFRRQNYFPYRLSSEGIC